MNYKEVKVKYYPSVYICDYPFADKMEKYIAPIIENSSDEHGQTTNVKARMTRWDWGDNLKGNVHLNKFKDSIIEILTNNMGVSAYDWNTKKPVYYKFHMKELWGNIYYKGDHTISHNHEPCFWSFAYFLKGSKRSSPFIFTDSGKKIPFEVGKLLLFPSYLNHHVPVNNLDEKRLTLSGNIITLDNL